MLLTKVVIPSLMLVLILYPSSLLGWSVLYGSNSLMAMAIISVLITGWSLVSKSLKDRAIFSAQKSLLVWIIFLLTLLLFFRLDTFLLREVIVIAVALLYFTGNRNNFSIVRRIFRFILIASLGMCVFLQLIPYDFGTKPIHGPLNLRDSWGEADYYTVFGLLVDRVQNGRHFMRYSAHFLEPTWLWLFLFIFTNKVKENITDFILGLVSMAWFGLFTLLIGGIIIGLRRHFFKIIIVLTLLYYVLIDIRNINILTLKLDQLLFMMEKDFFMLPDISLFGSLSELDRRFGLGILNIISKYGLVGMLLYLTLLFNNLNIALRSENNFSKVITIAFSIFTLKAGGFLIPHILYTISLKYDYNNDIVSTE